MSSEDWMFVNEFYSLFYYFLKYMVDVIILIINLPIFLFFFFFLNGSFIGLGF